MARSVLVGKVADTFRLNLVKIEDFVLLFFNIIKMNVLNQNNVRKLNVERDTALYLLKEELSFSVTISFF